MLSALPNNMCKASTLAFSLGNFGQKQVHVLARATANIKSAWTRGSQGIFCPGIVRSIAGTVSVTSIAELHGVTPSLPVSPSASPQR